MLFKTINQIFDRSLIMVLNQFALLISLPILASRLDFFVFGQIAIGFVIVQLSYVFSDWGIQQYTIENWYKKKNVLEKNNFVTLVLSLNFIISTVFLIFIFFLFLFKLINIPLFFLLCVVPSILMAGIYPLWFFQIHKCTSQLILPTFFARLIFIIIIYFFVIDNNSAYIALLAQGLNFSIISFIAFYIMYKKHSFYLSKYKFQEIFFLLRNSFPYLINSLTNNQINSLWVFGLSIFSGPTSVAIYNLGDQVYRSGTALTNIISQTIRINFIGKVSGQLSFIILLFAIFYLFFSTFIFHNADLIINTLFSSKYLDAVSVIQVMIVSWALNGITALISYPILGEKKSASYVNKVTIVILFVHFIAFLIWSLFFNSSFSMSIFFLGVICIQLAIFIINLLLIKFNTRNL